MPTTYRQLFILSFVILTNVFAQESGTVNFRLDSKSSCGARLKADPDEKVILGGAHGFFSPDGPISAEEDRELVLKAHKTLCERVPQNKFWLCDQEGGKYRCSECSGEIFPRLLSNEELGSFTWWTMTDLTGK